METSATGLVEKDDTGQPVGMQSCDCCVHKFQTPSGVMVVAPSQAGKSHLVCQLLLQRRHMFTKVPQNIIFVYSCWQEKYEDLQKSLKDDITFRTDIPTKEELLSIYNDNPIHRVLVIDDKFSAFKNGQQGSDLIELAAVITHHCLFTVFYISQNIFHSQVQRQIGLNCQYYIVFSNARSQQQVKVLGCQIFGPGHSKFFMESYKKAVSKPHGFLLVDLHPKTEDKFRLKSNILPSQDLTVYLEDK